MAVLRHSLVFKGNGPAGFAKHMIMPDTGYLIANAYNCKVHVFGIKSNILATFIPVDGVDTGDASISLLLKDGNTNAGHYMALELEPGSPLPCIVRAEDNMKK